MPVHDNEMRNMQRYIADSLDSSGEFSSIQTEYRFSGNGSNPLNHQSKRNILVVQRPEFAPNGQETPYLIWTHADANGITRADFAQRVVTASKEGIYTANVIHKFKGDEGALWRREAAELSDDAAYHRSPAYSKRSLQHIKEKHVRDRLRKLTDLERKWAYQAGGNRLFLYQPNSARLDEKLLKFVLNPIKRWDKRTGEYVTMGKWRDPGEAINEYDGNFTLQPITRVSQRDLRDRLDKATQDDIVKGRRDFTNRVSKDLSYHPLLLAEFTDFGGWKHARDKLVMLRQAYVLQEQGVDMLEEIAELIHGLCYNLQDEEDSISTDLSDQLDYILQENEGVSVRKTEETFMNGKRKTEKAKIKSRSNWVTEYNAQRTIDTETDEIISELCNCPGNRRHNHCKHTEMF